MMTIVRPKSKSVYQLGHEPRAWEVICRIEGRYVPPDIQLTNRAIQHWLDEHDDTTKYVSFKSLRIEDAISILSAVKRQEAQITVERWGRVAFYKLH